VNTFEKVGFIGNLGCVGRHTQAHIHIHTHNTHCVPRLPEPNLLYDAVRTEDLGGHAGEELLFCLYEASWRAERAMHSHSQLQRDVEDPQMDRATIAPRKYI